jgi:hypothetical protein
MPWLLKNIIIIITIKNLTTDSERSGFDSSIVCWGQEEG